MVVIVLPASQALAFVEMSLCSFPFMEKKEDEYRK